MLADRHSLPAASSVPALASTQPPIALGQARRRGWGWKGTIAGLAIGVLGAAVANRSLGTSTASDSLALRAADTARAMPSDNSPSQGQGAGLPYVPLPSRPMLPNPAAVPQAAPPAAQLPQPRVQPQGVPRPSASNFGLQP